MITTPENLSKDRLKAELKKHGIRFNNSENKPYYVELYRSKIMKESIKEQASEFSDDDYKPSPKPSRRKLAQTSAKKQSKNLQVYINHVQTLTNSELMDGLIRLGEDPGPINPSTRSVYEKKLAKLLEEEREKTPLKESPTSQNVEESFVGEWSDEEEVEEEEEEETIGEAEPESSIKYSRQYNLRSRHQRIVEEQDGSVPLESSRLRRSPQKTLRSSPPRSTPPRPSPSKSFTPIPRSRKRTKIPKEGSDACRIIWSILFVLIIFATVFLLYEHFTVPAGKTSLLVMGVGNVRDTLYSVRTYMFGVIAPLMEKQEVEAEGSEAPPPPPSEEPSKPPPKSKSASSGDKPSAKDEKSKEKPAKSKKPKKN